MTEPHVLAVLLLAGALQTDFFAVVFALAFVIAFLLAAILGDD
ncbi:hypothetical protein [Urbifossiella limnaea]|uniref:Uncharacterized protein n=1 Tax=Urbifossiella limnaea TaxID=2528023 RepID=A0A517XSX6_9BACT|nr:hypothetical protein [Urbifossiella limnaea]QDU20591.1 hypothetical protein ETAA1_25460 [Urbifossiella limnaea]